jgi:hypothetical protein
MIAVRNVFGLKQISQVQIVVDPAPVPRVMLKGITTMFTKKLAILTVQAPATAGEAAKTHSLILAEGQSEAGIEVTSIDEKSGVVVVNYRGSPLATLSF